VVVRGRAARTEGGDAPLRQGAALRRLLEFSLSPSLTGRRVRPVFSSSRLVVDASLPWPEVATPLSFPFLPFGRKGGRVGCLRCQTMQYPCRGEEELFLFSRGLLRHRGGCGPASFVAWPVPVGCRRSVAPMQRNRHHNEQTNPPCSPRRRAAEDTPPTEMRGFLLLPRASERREPGHGRRELS
jgi:hypothetical protein